MIRNLSAIDLFPANNKYLNHLSFFSCFYEANDDSSCNKFFLIRGFFPLKLCPRFHKNSSQCCFFLTHLKALLIVICHHCDALMSDADVCRDAISDHTISSWNNLKKTTIVPIISILFHSPNKIYVSQTNWTLGQFFVPFFYHFNNFQLVVMAKFSWLSTWLQLVSNIYM